jgi:predicted RND superfamily exporter protein
VSPIGNKRQPLASTTAFVAWTLRHGGILWAAAIALTIPATLRTADLYLHLRSDLEELLPTDVPSVVAIRELRDRMPGLQNLGVIVDSGLVRCVRTSDDAERRFVEDHLAQYAKLADLETLRKRIEARRDYDVEKASGALLDEDEPAPPLDFHDIENKYRRESRFDDGRFSNRALHLTLLLVTLGDFDTGRSHSAELLGRVRRDIAELGPAANYSSQLRVGFAGDVAIQVEETSALVADLTLSSGVVAALVVTVLLLYYRWWPSLAILLPPLLMATVFAFALASLPPLSVTALNSNTAFLGSIIVGNGINFGIVLLARYVEARRAGSTLEQALPVAVHGARKGTVAAAIAASVSYGSLALTQFRGFRQFGFVGGLGMLLSWGVAFLLMPPLIAWFDRKGAWAPRPISSRMRPMAWIARVVAFAPRALVLGSLVLTALAVWKVHTLDASWIESDFSRLRRADTWIRGEGYWGRRMEALLGTYLTPTVILTDDVAQARAIAGTIDAMRSTPPLSELIASLRTIDGVLPSDQPAKISEVQAIRADLTPRIRAAVPASQLESLDRLLGSDTTTPITADNLPPGLTAGLRERDGTLGREVLVFPRPSQGLWQGGILEELVQALRAAAQTGVEAGSRSGRVAGSLPLSADILAVVRHDGPRACIAALLGVILVVVLVLRSRVASALVIGSLLVAVSWLIATTVALGVRINFANFIAYPITFGIGVDYVVNVVTRYRQHPEQGVGVVLRSTGGAVALCSLTTVIGYSSLLMAQNRGLFLFGVVAVLGELCCICTALIALPALLEWNARRTGDAYAPPDSSRKRDPANTLDAP